jgi:hypothetical protein
MPKWSVPFCLLPVLPPFASLGKTRLLMELKKMLSGLSYNRDRSAGGIVSFEISVGSGQSGL